MPWLVARGAIWVSFFDYRAEGSAFDFWEEEGYTYPQRTTEQKERLAALAVARAGESAPARV